MIPNLVGPGMQFAQQKLYEFQSTFLVDESRVTRRDPSSFYSEVRTVCETDQYVLLNRLLAVPVVVIDLALEALKPVCVAVESAAFVLVSLGAIFYHLLQGNLDEVKRDFRIALFNFASALHCGILIPFQAAVIPLLAIGQLFVTIAEPLASQPSYKNFPSDVRIAKPISDTQWSQPENNEKIGIEEFQYRMYRDVRIVAYRSLPVGRVIGGIASFFDALAEVVDPLVKTIASFVKGIFVLLLAPCSLTLGATDKAQAHFEHGVALLNTAAHSLAFTISKAILFPLKLIVQLAVTVYDPKNAMPSPRGLYSAMVGDRALTMKGIATRAATNCSPFDPAGPHTSEMDPWYGT